MHTNTCANSYLPGSPVESGRLQRGGQDHDARADGPREGAAGRVEEPRHKSPDNTGHADSEATTSPPSICTACWKGPFAAQLGLFHEQIQQTVPEGDRVVTTGGYAYSTSVAELQSGAITGCQWCRLVLAVYARDYRHFDKGANVDGDRNSNNSDAADSGANPPHIQVRVGCLHSDLQLRSTKATPEERQELAVLINEWISFTGCVYAHADDPAGACIITRPRVLDVGSPRSLALAKACIRECMQGHERCSVRPPTSPAPLLPTRLIDCHDPSRPRLVTTKGDRGEYAALSYVWGEAQPHETTTSKMATYANMIDPLTLPQTILDAIHVTHALGLRYLWIDSLCIIQDSLEDKRNEISRMRHVYRDAYLTIIASSAQRVSEGFLQNRPPVPHTGRPQADGTVLVPDITFPFVCPRPAGDVTECSSGQLGTIHLFPVEFYAPRQIRTKALMDYDPTGEPISSRGWTMQEYLMSPRSLVFTSHTLQFHCQETIMNVGRSYNRVRASAEKRLPPVLLSEDLPAVAHHSKEWFDVHLSWLIIIVDYTKRSVTLPSDKLVACGGIAEECHRALRTDYLAGLWRDFLHFDLLWSKRGDLVPLPRPEKYRAPSWSWAAAEGAISPGGHELFPGPWTSISEVVRCEVTLEDDALPFGGVSGGFLVLRTPLIACIWNTGNPNYLRRASPFTDSSEGPISSSDDEDTEARIGLGYLDSEDDAGVREVWAAPIHWRPTYTAGIIVCLADGYHGADNGTTKYRRIGYFDTGDLGAGRPVAGVRELPLVEIEII